MANFRVPRQSMDKYIRDLYVDINSRSGLVVFGLGLS